MESLTTQAASIDTKAALNSKQYPNGWILLEQSDQTPSQRSLHVGTVLEDALYVFGGYDGTQRTNDFYRYEFFSAKWIQINALNQPPSPRDRHAAVVYDKSIYIFGGFDGVNRVNDFYCYNAAKNEWTEVPDKKTNPPPTPRHSHSACVYKNQVYVFSGYDGLYKNDLHKFSFETHEWTMIKDSNPSAENWPKPRYRTSLSVYKDKIYMFGGHDGTRQLNDFYYFDPKFETWSQIVITDFIPSPRDSHAAVVYDTSMFIFGGSTGATVSSTKNDFYEFDFEEKKWHQIQCPNIPPSRFCHIGASHNKKFYIFGGYDGETRLNDFYEYAFEPEAQLPDSTLISDLRNLVNNPTLSDVVFKFQNENKVIYAHKILLLRVPYFSAMFLGDMRESKQQEIKIERISYQTFLDLLNYVYTDKFETKSIQNMVELFEVADLYSIDRLKMICEKQIFQMIDIEKVSDILFSADKREASKLREYALSFIVKNFDAVSKTKSFENLLRRDQELIIEILRLRQDS